MWDAVGRPVMRGSITVIAAVGWFILSIFLFLVYLPQFKYYEFTITNRGFTDNDIWFFWAWIPTLAVLVLGIFWASGVFAKIEEALSNL